MVVVASEVLRLCHHDYACACVLPTNLKFPVHEYSDFLVMISVGLALGRSNYILLVFRICDRI